MKNKLKHIAGISAVLLLICFMTSCGYGDRAHPADTEHIFKGYQKATIIDYTVDGCKWMLQLEDGKKLQPLELKPEFQKDQLKVWVMYEIKKGAVGICMAGEIVNITNIELRKK
jgi:hypothetical protein